MIREKLKKWGERAQPELEVHRDRFVPGRGDF